MTERAGIGDGPASSAETAEPAVIILSGLSGGGKTAAAKLFEDLGYTVIDNLPGELLSDLAELVSSDRTRFAQVAIVMDVRAGDTLCVVEAMKMENVLKAERDGKVSKVLAKPGDSLNVDAVILEFA